MDRTLTHFIAALRNAEVRISPAETLDAMNAVELVGYRDRAFLKDSLSLVLPQTADEKETFDTTFDQFFSFEDVAGHAAALLWILLPNLDRGYFATLFAVVLCGAAVFAPVPFASLLPAVGVTVTGLLYVAGPMLWGILLHDLSPLWLFFVLLIGQTVADQQQWNFQQDKKRRIAAGEDVTQPFLTTGLFRYSRHPNYFCEIAMWCVFYLFSVAASGQWLHWTGLGCIGLILLIIPSLRMTEKISASKYPAYGDYQATTSALIPLPPRGK